MMDAGATGAPPCIYVPLQFVEMAAPVNVVNHPRHYEPKNISPI